MEEEQKYYYHKMPAASKTTAKTSTAPEKKPWFIGIIDSSGSMCSWWPHVAKNYNDLIDELATDKDKTITFCFDSNIHPVPNSKLQTDIHAHGGGMTNIFAAMQKLDNYLAKIPIEDEVRVCFVSDGQDTCNSNLNNRLQRLKGFKGRSLTFMCVGVQSGFPTKVSMFLREKYHRGDSTVPSIFLIEYASDKAFFNKFQSLRQYCAVKQDLTVDPPQRLFPWEQPVEVVPEGIWVMSRQKEVTVNGEQQIVYNDEDFNVDAICDIFRSWSQKLQLDSLNRKITFAQAQEFAMSAHGLMMNIINDVKQSRGLDLLSGKTTDKKDFMSTVLNLQVIRTSLRIKGFLDAVNEIKEGKDLSNLNEFEAAKVIGLGTIVGKAQQRALALKNMNQETFLEYIEEFIAEVEQIDLQEETGFVDAYETDSHLRKLLSDPTFIPGLRKFKSPIDFLDIFPLFGLAINIKRSEGYQTDAYKVAVKSYDSQKKFLDSSSFDFSTHKLNIKGDKEYNCVCPLIPKQDAYLAPLFNTRLMKYILSYNTTEALDSTNENSWVVLLSDLFVLATKADDHELVQQIVDTISAIKGWGKWEEVLSKIEVGDASVFKNIRKSTFLLAHYYFCSTNTDLEDEEKEEVIQKIWINYFNKRLVKGSVKDFVQTEAASDLKGKLLAKFTPEYIASKFYTSKEIVRYMKKGIFKEMDDLAAEASSNNIVLIPNGFTSDSKEDISFKLVKKVLAQISVR